MVFLIIRVVAWLVNAWYTLTGQTKAVIVEVKEKIVSSEEFVVEGCFQQVVGPSGEAEEYITFTIPKDLLAGGPANPKRRALFNRMVEEFGKLLNLVDS